MVVVRFLGIRRADDDEAVARAQHEDVRAVEVGEHVGAQHLVGRAQREAAVRDVEDAVDLAEQRVDVVGHEQNRGVRVLAMPVDEPDDRLLVGEVEARERLVAQQQARVVGERLSDAQPLLLATGEQADRGGRRTPARRRRR